MPGCIKCLSILYSVEDRASRWKFQVSGRTPGGCPIIAVLPQLFRNRPQIASPQTHFSLCPDEAIPTNPLEMVPKEAAFDVPELAHAQKSWVSLRVWHLLQSAFCITLKSCHIYLFFVPQLKCIVSQSKESRLFV